MTLPDDFIYDLEDKMRAMSAIRRRAGYSQQEIADLLGVNQSRVARWERMEEFPRFPTLVTLTRLLDQMQIESAEKEAQ